jgi:hypothetical protein
MPPHSIELRSYSVQPIRSHHSECKCRNDGDIERRAIGRRKKSYLRDLEVSMEGTNKIGTHLRNRWFDEAFLRQERPPSVRQNPEMSFRSAVAVPEKLPHRRVLRRLTDASVTVARAVRIVVLRIVSLR